MGSKKGIIIVANNIDGGVATFLEQVAKFQTDKSNTIHASLVSLQKNYHTKLPTFSSISFFPKKREKLYYQVSISDAWYLFQELLWLKKEISKNNYRIILSIDVHTSLLVCLLKKLFLKSSVVIISNRNNVTYTTLEKLSPFLRKMLQVVGHFLFKEANIIICGSQGSAKSFQDFFSITQFITTIPNSIDLSKAKKQAQKPLTIHDQHFFNKRCKTVLSIGRLEKQKDFETIINAMFRVEKSVKNVQLLIIGDGTQKNNLESYIKKKNLTNCVFLLGWRENIYPYLKLADIFVLSSHYEGFSFVLLEALSQGIPILATDSPFGPKEVLGNGQYGILTPISDEKKMATHIIDLLENKTKYKYLAKQSKKRSLFYDEKKIIKRYKKIFHENDFSD